jgi:uncharacterized protein YndB with AHSA1/START domain
MPRPRISASIVINLPTEDLFDFALSDLDSMPDWMTSVDSVASVDGRWPDVGSSHVYVRKIGEKEQRGRTSVDEVDRPRRVVMTEQTNIEKPAEDPSRIGRTVWTFDPEAGGTRFTITLEGTDLNPLIYVLFRLFAAKSVSTNLNKSLSELKRICEQELEDAQ